MESPTRTASDWGTPGQWLVEVLAGALLGFALAAAIGFAGARAMSGSASGFGDLIAAILGALIGYTMGASAGVYLAARLLGRPGSFWLALAGAIAAAALVLLLAEPLRLNVNPAILQTTLAVAAPLLAALALNVGRLRKR